MYRNTKLANPLVHVLYIAVHKFLFVKLLYQCRVSVETWQLLGVVAVSGNVDICT